MNSKTILAFYETWLHPSYLYKFNQNLEKLAKFPGWSIEKLSIEAYPNLKEKFHVEYLPAILCYKSDEEFQLFDGNSLLKPITSYLKKVQ